jgi:hypothetical protein
VILLLADRITEAGTEENGAKAREVRDACVTGELPQEGTGGVHRWLFCWTVAAVLDRSLRGLSTHHVHRVMEGTVAEMAGAATWERLRGVLGGGQHVIVAGGAGCGKSHALRLLLSGAVALWFRCSADPSLRDGRDRIKTAAKRRTTAPSWIVLEHADLLHADAQAFLRRVIETATGSVRFVLEVRDLSAVAEPLLSRTVLFNVPPLMEFEVRAEVLRRAPTVSGEVAARLAAQAGGNVRWAVLQALGGGDGFLDPSVGMPVSESGWAGVLATMEALQRTGSAPRALLAGAVPAEAWERPGGACPWSLTARALAAGL